jgi:predicted nucleic acid-binding Zn ribbon protein
VIEEQARGPGVGLKGGVVVGVEVFDEAEPDQDGFEVGEVAVSVDPNGQGHGELRSDGAAPAESDGRRPDEILPPDPTTRACAFCGGPIAPERRQSSYCSSECRIEQRDKRKEMGVVDPKAAWRFATDERLFRSLDHRAAVHLREPDLAKVEKARAAVMAK